MGLFQLLRSTCGVEPFSAHNPPNQRSLDEILQATQGSAPNVSAIAHELFAAVQKEAPSMSRERLERVHLAATRLSEQELTPDAAARIQRLTQWSHHHHLTATISETKRRIQALYRAFPQREEVSIEQQQASAREIFTLADEYREALLQHMHDENLEVLPRSLVRARNEVEEIEKTLLLDIVAENYTEASINQNNIENGHTACGPNAIAAYACEIQQQSADPEQKITSALHLGAHRFTEQINHLNQNGVRRSSSSISSARHFLTKHFPNMDRIDLSSENFHTFMDNSLFPSPEIRERAQGAVGVKVKVQQNDGHTYRAVWSVSLEGTQTYRATLFRLNREPTTFETDDWEELKTTIFAYLGEQGITFDRRPLEYAPLPIAPGCNRLYDYSDLLSREEALGAYTGFIEADETQNNLQWSVGITSTPASLTTEANNNGLASFTANKHVIYRHLLTHLAALTNRPGSHVGGLLIKGAAYHTVIIKTGSDGSKRFVIYDSHGSTNIARRRGAFRAEFKTLEDASRFLELLNGEYSGRPNSAPAQVDLTPIHLIEEISQICERQAAQEPEENLSPALPKNSPAKMEAEQAFAMSDAELSDLRAFLTDISGSTLNEVFGICRALLKTVESRHKKREEFLQEVSEDFAFQDINLNELVKGAKFYSPLYQILTQRLAGVSEVGISLHNRFLQTPSNVSRSHSGRFSVARLKEILREIEAVRQSS